MSAENKSYDRQEKETTKAYAAFCIYRDMGVDRSLKKTAQKCYPALATHDRRTHPNIRLIERWCTLWRWIDRCKEYDRDCELRDRSAKSEIDREAYIKDLEGYQFQQKSIGTAAMNFTARSLQAIDYALTDIHAAVKSKKKLTSQQINVLFSSQLAGKNAMAISTAGGELKAKGLAIEELMKHVQNEIDALESQL
jgi:hypothetical protein